MGLRQNKGIIVAKAGHHSSKNPPHDIADAALNIRVHSQPVVVPYRSGMSATRRPSFARIATHRCRVKKELAGGAAPWATPGAPLGPQCLWLPCRRPRPPQDRGTVRPVDDGAPAYYYCLGRVGARLRRQALHPPQRCLGEGAVAIPRYHPPHGWWLSRRPRRKGPASHPPSSPPSPSFTTRRSPCRIPLIRCSRGAILIDVGCVCGPGTQGKRDVSTLTPCRPRPAT